MPRHTQPAPLIEQPIALPDTVPVCHALIYHLMQRLSPLEERVNLNPRNSSKPPSSDGPATLALPSKPTSGKKLGGQPGHKGSFRAMVPEQDVHHRIECLPPAQCNACGSAVDVDGDKPIRHQVFELPKIEPTQAGQFHLTQRKVQSVLSHIMGIRFSLGAVSQAHGLVSQALDKPVAQLHAELQHAPVCNADETRHQNHQYNLWMWVLAGYGYLLFRWRNEDKDARHFAWLQRRMRVQLELGHVQTQCTANTCANLLKMWPAMWTFMGNPLVPPTNNAAQRALRDYVFKCRTARAPSGGWSSPSASSPQCRPARCKRGWRMTLCTRRCKAGSATCTRPAWCPSTFTFSIPRNLASGLWSGLGVFGLQEDAGWPVASTPRRCIPGTGTAQRVLNRRRASDARLCAYDDCDTAEIFGIQRGGIHQRQECHSLGAGVFGEQERERMRGWISWGCGDKRHRVGDTKSRGRVSIPD